MDQIIGHDRVKQTLATLYASGRLHHAYIFHGPTGVGKHTTALALARVLLCHQPNETLTGDFEPCNQCRGCNAWTAQGDHDDLHVVRKELAAFSSDKQIRGRKLTTIPVEVLRQSLLEPVYRRAHLDQRKVFIVDEAELIANEGQNLLLKTLEEPPADTYIMLVTSAEDRLLPTIRSRCQRIAFSPLSDEQLGTWLDQHMPEVEATHRQWLIWLGQGSPGVAQLAHEFGMVKWGQYLAPAVDQISRGQRCPELGAQMAQMVDDFATQWTRGHANASKEAANRTGATRVLAMLGRLLRRKLRTQLSTTSPGDLTQQGQRSQIERWTLAIEALRQTELQLASNVNLSLACDALSARLHECLAQPHSSPKPARST